MLTGGKMPNSASSPSQPSPAEQLARDISSLQSDVSFLHSQVLLSSTRDAIEDLETLVRGLPQRVHAIRTRKYAFGKDLENHSQDLNRRWPAVRSSVQSQIEIQASQLNQGISQVELQMNRLVGMRSNVALGRQNLPRVQSEVANLKSKVSAAESSLRGMYDAFEDEIRAFVDQVGKVEWTMGQVDEACFSLTPTEAPVMAVKAVWYQDQREEKEDPDGVLYLTDQRLIFEQKEEIATKKVLFITTERQKVQKLLFEEIGRASCRERV
jgi:chromosome segregation ATPase